MKVSLSLAKSFFTANFWYLALFVVIVLFTALLLGQRDLLADKAQDPNSRFLSAIQIESWEPYYGGGQGLDNVISIDGQSLKISSGADGGWYGAKAAIDPINFNDKAIRFSFRFENLEDAKSLLIIFGTDDGELQNYFSFNIMQYFADPASGQWHEVVVDKSDFEVAEGEPDWSHVSDVAVRLIGEPAVATRVWVDGLSTVDVESDPLISITFDDGFASVMDAKDIMDTFDLKGTLYAIPSLLGTENYLSQSDIDLLHLGGWDISGHSNINLRLFEHYGDADTELASVHEYLLEHDYRGKDHFAYPNGGYDESARSLVLEYFDTARTIDGLSQPQGYVIPSKINAKTVSVDTTTDEIKEWITDAIENDSWLIITWHDIVESGDLDTQYSKSGFTDIMQFIASSGVEVLPFSEAYKKVTERNQ